MQIPIEKIKAKRLLVIGDLMLDIYLRGKASRISPEAPVPIVTAERRDFIPGGAANVMANLCSLACDVTGAGFLGIDDEGKFLHKALESMSVRTECIIPTELPTIHKTRVLANGHHLIRFDFDTNFSKVSEEKKQQLIGYVEALLSTRSFDAVIVSDYHKGTITEELIGILTRRCTCPIIVDTKPQHKTFYNGVSCMTPNLEEAKQMIRHLPGDDPVEIARTLKKEMSLQSVIITLADKGVLLIDEQDQAIAYEAYTRFDEHDPTQRFDVTGAGDTVISVFAACRAAGIDARRSVYTANVAAGVVVKKIGTAQCSFDELSHELSKENNNEGRTA